METPDSDLLPFSPSTYEDQWKKAVKFLMGEDKENGICSIDFGGNVTVRYSSLSACGYESHKRKG